jgi:hypothetical protein
MKITCMDCGQRVEEEKFTQHYFAEVAVGALQIIIIVAILFGVGWLYTGKPPW